MSVEAGLDTHAIVYRSAGFTLDLSLRIEPGRTAALLGPNGAGKSTALAAIAGLIPLDGGQITLSGMTLDDAGSGVFVPPEERRIGVMFQDHTLFPHLTVSDNIAFGLKAGRSVARRMTADWMGRLDLEGLADRRPGDLSGGQAQRVALARALVIEPDLLLLDEPLSALDVTAAVRLRRLLAEHLGHFAGPRLLITHDPTEAFLLSDEIHVIEDGTVTQVGTADDIRLRPRTPYAADLAGSNLVVGNASRGIVTTTTHQLHVADTHITGPVLATIHPRAISIHREQPEGSPRNTWRTSVALIEDLGERIRLNVAGPLPLTVEVTPDARHALDLRVGSGVWVSIKATEIGVETD